METVPLVTLILVVLFVVIMTTISCKKKKHYNTYTENLDGEILSYECQNTGIEVDQKNRTVTVYNNVLRKTYSFNDIKEINYTLAGATTYHGSGSLKSMNNAALANAKEKGIVNERSGIFILTDDIKNPSWKVNVPVDNKTASSNKQICDRWVLIFQKYVF